MEVLLRALSFIPDAAAVVVGDGPDRAHLESLADELQLRPRLAFEGWRDDARRLVA